MFEKFPVGLPGYPRDLPGATGKFSKKFGFFNFFGFFPGFSTTTTTTTTTTAAAAAPTPAPSPTPTVLPSYQHDHKRCL